MERLEFEAGRLLWGAIRSAVKRCQFEGYNISVWEGSGFIEREFKIRGDAAAVNAIRSWLKRISDN